MLTGKEPSTYEDLEKFKKFEHLFYAKKGNLKNMVIARDVQFLDVIPATVAINSSNKLYVGSTLQDYDLMPHTIDRDGVSYRLTLEVMRK